MLEITKISDRVIEVGIDPTFNRDYEDGYATRFSVGEVKEMLACLGLDYDKNQELIDQQAQSIKFLREAIIGAKGFTWSGFKFNGKDDNDPRWVALKEALVATGGGSNG